MIPIEIQKKVTELINNSHIKEALGILQDYAEEKELHALRELLDLLEGRWNRLEKERIAGIISKEASTLQVNQIANDVISVLKHDHRKDAEEKQKAKKSNRLLPRTLGTTVMIFLASLVWVIIDIPPDDEPIDKSHPVRKAMFSFRENIAFRSGLDTSIWRLCCYACRLLTYLIL